MTSSILPGPRKKPKQERARRAVEAIEQACLKILEKEGPQHLTTNRIAEVAGVNISSLYQYFPNKEAILAAVYAAKLRAESEAAVLKAPTLAKVASQSLEDALRGLIQSYTDPRRRFSHLNEEFYGRYHAMFDLRADANEQALAHGQLSFDEWFLTVLKRHRARLRVADLKLASFLVTHTLEGIFRLAVEERPDLLDSQAFQDELFDLLLRYLDAGPA